MLKIVEFRFINFIFETVSFAIILIVEIICSCINAFLVSGMQWCEISECVEWMSAFAQVIKEEKVSNSPMRLQNLSGNTSEDSYQKQTHSVDLNLLVGKIHYV